jgi:predicted secreted protein
MMRNLLLALLFVPLSASAQAPETLFNLVSLNAEADREIPNDLLTATLVAEAEGAEPAQLADGVNRAMQRALSTALAVKSVKAQSGGYQTIPVYDKTRVVRWRVRQELRLESADFAAATELIGKLQASLIVTGMNLTVSAAARRKAENALMADALAAFEERARVVSDAMKAKGYRRPAARRRARCSQWWRAHRRILQCSPQSSREARAWLSLCPEPSSSSRTTQ